MKLTSLPQFARNVIRLREIATILGKYSVADWISRLDLDFARRFYRTNNGTALIDLTHETRVRLALSELGPTFIKLGQMLSTRADMVGPAMAQELSQLQTSAPADPFPSARSTVESELGQPLRELFADFDEKPLASASIAQVHRARLPDGRSVAVKVQHVNIEAKVRVDLDILVGFAELAEDNLEEMRKYRPRATAAEFQRMLLRELDFGREERNLQQFAANFKSDVTVRFPAPMAELSTGRVLTMEYFEGIKLAEPQRLQETHVDLEEIARRGATVFLDMIFRDGFYHADPHPGNILLLPGGVIGLIDCGMVGRLDDRTREDIEEMLLAIAQRDAARLTALLTRIGSVPSQLDTGGLSGEVAEFMAYYGGQSLRKLDLGKALTDLTGIVRRYHILLPASIALLIKVLVMLEGTSRLLNPNFDLTALLKPYQRKLLWRYLSPARRMQKLKRIVQEWRYLAEILPRSVGDILQSLQHSRFEMHVEHKRLEPTLNRLTFGMVTSALFLGSALMLSFHVPPTWDGVSLPGAIGAVFGFLMALRLLWAINNSGRLD